MELEIQTGAHIDLRVMPTWPKGKSHQYHTTSAENHHEEEDQPSQDTEVDSEPADPGRQVLGEVSTDQRSVSVSRPNACRVCGQDTDHSFWLGCGYTHPKTKRQDCKYWVHQKCIGLCYKKETDLGKVPFYCPKHMV